MIVTEEKNEALIWKTNENYLSIDEGYSINTFNPTSHSRSRGTTSNTENFEEKSKKRNTASSLFLNIKKIFSKFMQNEIFGGSRQKNNSPSSSTTTTTTTTMNTGLGLGETIPLVSSASPKIGIKQQNHKIPIRLWRLLLILAILCGVALTIHAIYLMVVAVYVDSKNNLIRKNNHVTTDKNSHKANILISHYQTYKTNPYKNNKRLYPVLENMDKYPQTSSPSYTNTYTNKDYIRMKTFKYRTADNTSSLPSGNNKDSAIHQNVLNEGEDEYQFPLSNILYPSTLDAIVCFLTEFLPVATVLFLIRKKKKPSYEKSDTKRRRLSSISSIESLSILKGINLSPEMNKALEKQGQITQTITVRDYNTFNTNDTFVRAKYGDTRGDHLYGPYSSSNSASATTRSSDDLFQVNNVNHTIHFFGGATIDEEVKEMHGRSYSDIIPGNLHMNLPDDLKNTKRNFTKHSQYSTNIPGDTNKDYRHHIHFHVPLFDEYPNTNMNSSENDQITNEDSHSIMGLYNPIL